MLQRIIALCLLTSLASAREDYQCSDADGCTARITENGVVEEVDFRLGDMVSTEAGWMISADDGWVKVKTSYGWRGYGNVYLGGNSCLSLGIVNRMPRMHGGFAGQRPVTISLIGVAL